MKVGNIKVLRFVYTPESTIGEVWYNSTLFGYSIEDHDRGLRQDMTLEEIKNTKIQDKTAIPSGSYTVTLVVKNGNDLCNDTVSKVITVMGEPTVIVPNIFSPNNDNINDVMSIQSTGFKELNISIFNR